ncbi:MAG: ribbon-helix-helix domain-containing protein [Gallionellaceae bacterium]|jgi:predicted transcriptional regulator|nr:ribbon-helix-helix domain-containing protein [Gallionellaceae bacterium]
MAATTTLKLPEELKARIATAAQTSGKSPHAFMVEALETQTCLAEMRQSFINDAIASADEVDAGGALYAMEDVRTYILARTSGKTAKRPKPIARAGTKLTDTKNKSRTSKRTAR